MKPAAQLAKPQRGFTVPELLAGAAISVLMLTGIIQLFLMGTKLLQAKQQQAMVADNLQTAMQIMVNEVRWAVTTDPRASGTGNGAAPFNQLPQLPYNCVTIDHCHPGPSDPVLPAVPALGLYPSQDGISLQWYPVPAAAPLDSEHPETNYMAFYKVDRGVYHQILFMLGTDPSEPTDQALLKLDTPFDPAVAPPQPGTPLVTVLLHYVKELQFTYPLLLPKATDTAFQAWLLDKRNEGQNVLDKYLNENYRGVVGVRVVCYVPIKIKVDGVVKLDKDHSPVQEARAEVSVRN